MRLKMIYVSTTKKCNATKRNPCTENITSDDINIVIQIWFIRWRVSLAFVMVAKTKLKLTKSMSWWIYK